MSEDKIPGIHKVSRKRIFTGKVEFSVHFLPSLNFFWVLRLGVDSSIGSIVCLLVCWSGTITLLTIVEQSQRLVTLETCDQSDDLSSDFGKISDFWKMFRFLENFQIFGKFSDFWKIFRFLEDFQIFGRQQQQQRQS